MASKAALKALEQAKVNRERNRSDPRGDRDARHDLSRPPPVSSKRRSAPKNAACLDVSAACAGFLFGIEIAQQFITSHTHDTVLVIGAEKLSSITNWTDRNTCVLFGDGAGAAVLQHRGSAHGVISTHIGSDGEFTDILCMPGGGSRCADHGGERASALATIQMTGKDVYKQAVISMLNASNKALEKAGLTTEDIACVIPHQANMRIIEAIADRMKIPLERFYVNLDATGTPPPPRSRSRSMKPTAAAASSRRLHSDGRLRRRPHLGQHRDRMVMALRVVQYERRRRLADCFCGQSELCNLSTLQC